MSPQTIEESYIPENWTIVNQQYVIGLVLFAPGSGWLLLASAEVLILTFWNIVCKGLPETTLDNFPFRVTGIQFQ